VNVHPRRLADDGTGERKAEMAAQPAIVQERETELAFKLAD
jgi:hypothetical protein